MIVTIRPLDRPDSGLEPVAKANRVSLHAGVTCEGSQSKKTRASLPVHRTSRRRHPPSINQLYW